MNHFLNLRQDTTQHSADVYISFSSFTSREKTNLQTMIFRKHSLLMKAIPGFQIQDEHLFIPCSQVSFGTWQATSMANFSFRSSHRAMVTSLSVLILCFQI